MALAFCMVVGTAAVMLPEAGQAATSDRRGTATAKPAKASSPSGPAKAARAAEPSRHHASSRAKTRQATTAQGQFRRAAYYGGGGLSCVPYVRMVTGMEVSGNGGHWWHNAAGLYARGQNPEPGSVMAFRSSGGMSRGHVAVVRRVLGPRHVQIDHANWSGPGVRRGTVMRDVSVIDVSDRNDWTAVRVQVGYDSGTFGRVYPTYGFIYNRPDSPTWFAGGPSRAAQPVRAANHPTWEELAEAPAAASTQRRR